MWRLIFFLVPFVATVWALFNMRGIRAPERKAIIVVLLMLCGVHFSIQDYLVHFGHYPFVGAKFLHDLCSVFMLPLVHLLFCYSLGITSELRFMRILLCLCFLMIPDFLVFLDTPAGRDYAVIGERFNYIHLQFGENAEVKIDMYVLIFITQLIIEIQRISVLRRIFKKRDLYLSRAGRWVLRGTIATAVWIVIALIPTHEYKMEHAWALNFILIGNCFFITLVFVMVTLFFSNEIVVDVDQKTAKIEKDNDSELAEMMKTTLEIDKVYLNSNLRIEEWAGMLLTNRTYVARVCKNKFNMTFTELMNRYRVAHAKMLLLDDDRKRIEDIAAESGFSSASFFARVFKQHEGVTPSVWRSRELEVKAKKTINSNKLLHEGMTTEEALMVGADEVNETPESEVGEVNSRGGVKR